MIPALHFLSAQYHALHFPALSAFFISILAAAIAASTSHWACRIRAAAIGECPETPSTEFTLGPCGLTNRACNICQRQTIPPSPPRTTTLWAIWAGTLAIAAALPNTTVSPIIALLIAGLSAPAIIDGRDGILPDFLLWPLFMLGLAASALWAPITTPSAAALAAALMWFGFSTLRQMTILLPGPEMGRNDTFLAAILGVWLGPTLSIYVIGIAITIALALGIHQWHHIRHSTDQARPSITMRFGPCVVSALAFAPWLSGF